MRGPKPVRSSTALAGGARGLWTWFAAALGLWTALAWRSLALVPADFPDAMDYGQLARHLAQGRGFVTNFILPLSLARHPGLPQPELMHPPMTSLLTALGFLAFGEGPRTLALPSGLGFAFLTGLSALFARRAGGRITTWALPLLILLSPLALFQSLRGSSDLPAAAFFLASVLAFSGERPLLSGFLLGLGLLTRQTLILTFPCFLLLHPPGRRRKPWLRAGIAALATMSPWLIRNFRVAGSPFFSWLGYEFIMFSPEHPMWSWYRGLDQGSPAAVLLSHLKQHGASFLIKILDGLAWILRTAPEALAPPLLPALALGALAPNRPFRNFTLACLLTHSLLTASTHPYYEDLPRYSLFLLPFLLFLSTRALEELWNQNRVIPALLLGGALLCGVQGLIWAARPAPEHPEEIYADVDRTLPAGALGTDLPWIGAWYMNRPSLWLPENEADLGTCENLLSPAAIQGLYLSPLVNWEPGRVFWKAAFRERPVKLGPFVLLKAYPDGSLLYGRGA